MLRKNAADCIGRAAAFFDAIKYLYRSYGQKKASIKALSARNSAKQLKNS